MNSTRIKRHFKAPRARVYHALVDAASVATWMVPDGMTSQVHVFEAREGGTFRISLTYEDTAQQGKSSAHTDSYHGHFVRLVPDTLVEQVVEFETTEAALRGAMTITFALSDEDGGTEMLATHENLPPGLSPVANDVGWRLSLRKLAALVEETS